MYRLAYLLILTCLFCFSRCIFASENVTVEEVPMETLVNLTGNNELWTILLKGCQNPSLECVQKNIFNYLKHVFDQTEDLEFTSFMKFTKNNLDYNKIERTFDTDTDSTNNTYIYEDESPIESLSRSLQDNTARFLMTHDLELSLPDGLFPNSFLKISPRGLQDHGALVNLEVVPKDLETNTGLKEEGRTFKKIRKFVTEKVIYALLALLLVVKLLAVKFLFVLPLLVGAATAKKLLLKLLLFVFPFLHHVFKFCAYYPIQAKYHHHKHLIAHIHKIAPPTHHDHAEYGPPPFDTDGPPSYGHHDHHEYDDEVSVFPDDGSGFPHGLISHRKDPTRDENEIVSYGQGKTTRRKPSRLLTSTEIERIVDKAKREALIKARLEKERLRIREENLRLQDQLNQAVKLQEKLKQQSVFFNKKLLPTKITASVPYSSKTDHHGNPFRGPPIDGGSLQRPAISDEPGIDLPAGYLPQHVAPQQPPVNHPFQISQFDEQYQTSQVNVQNQPGRNNFDHGPIYKPSLPSLQSSTQEVRKGPLSSSAEIDFQKSIEYDPRNPAHVEKNAETPFNKNQFITYNGQNPAKVADRHEVVETPAYSKSKLEQEISQAASITHDPFYSPILEKIDKILQALGFIEEPCKERLICSMYKSPTKFSPHSNLLSSELSRDSSELQKPKSTNSAVIRFYKYVQAARNGQDQRDCLRLYTGCTIDTEVS